MRRVIALRLILLSLLLVQVSAQASMIKVLSQTYTLSISLWDFPPDPPPGSYGPYYYHLEVSRPTPLPLADALDEIPPDRRPYVYYHEATLRNTYAIGVADSSAISVQTSIDTSATGRTSAEVVFQPSEPCLVNISAWGQSHASFSTFGIRLVDMTADTMLVDLDPTDSDFLWSTTAIVSRTEQFSGDPTHVYRLTTWSGPTGFSDPADSAATITLSPVPEHCGTLTLCWISMVALGGLRALRRVHVE